MRDLWDVAWHRFTVISSVVSDVNARIIAILFYFTILVPFGIGVALFSDPLRRKTANGHPVGLSWLDREPVESDLDSAKLQG